MQKKFPASTTTEWVELLKFIAPDPLTSSRLTKFRSNRRTAWIDRWWRTGLCQIDFDMKIDGMADTPCASAWALPAGYSSLPPQRLSGLASTRPVEIGHSPAAMAAP